MFSFEDLMTDSTSALKDTRYPTVSMRRQNSSVVNEYEPARIVTLGRSVSVASRRGRCEQARRNRYISECSSSDVGSIFDLSTSKCKTPPPTRVHSFCSVNSSYGRRRKESVISSATSAGLVLDDVPRKRDLIEEEKEEDEEEDDLDVTTVTPDRHPIVGCWNYISQFLGLSLCQDHRFAIVVISVMSMSVGEICFHFAQQFFPRSTFTQSHEELFRL